MWWLCAAAAELAALRAEAGAEAALAAASSESAFVEAAGRVAIGGFAGPSPRKVPAAQREPADEAAPAFPRYDHQVAALDGAWDFAFGAAEVPTTPTTTLEVPGPLPEDRGLALYRRKLDIPGGRYSRLQFFGCGFVCEVYIDGEKAAAHEGAYTMFWVDVPMKPEDRTVELRVHADSRFQDDVLVVAGGGAANGEYRPTEKRLHEKALAYASPNGHELRRHEGGWAIAQGDTVLYTAPDLASPWSVAGGPEPAPQVTDASNVAALHKAAFDFMQYGGLIRPVRLHVLPAGVTSMIVDVDVKQDAHPHVASAPGTALRFRIHHMAEPQALRVTVTSKYLTRALELTLPAAPLAKLEVTLAGPHWSPGTPHLATLHVAGPMGGLTTRFGLRRVTACEDEDHQNASRVCIDGQPTKLLGFNMHNLDPQYQSSLPLAQIRAQVLKAKATGANFLRLVHYPHDPRVLEVADESGMLVWAETLGWGTSQAELLDPTFGDAQVAMLDEAVHVTFNHPSVIIYGFLNEGANDAVAACGIYKSLSERYRAWQVNGLVSWASNRYENDKCLEHADVITYNTYPGWYGGGPEDVASSLSSMAAQARQANPKKPFLIGEIGAAAIPSQTKWAMPPFLADHLPDGGRRGQWSEQYQADVDRSAAAAAVEDVHLAGAALWQLFDVATGESLRYLRPRGMNNKGVLTEALAPKAAYSAVKAEFSEATGLLAPPLPCRDTDCGHGMCAVGGSPSAARCLCHDGWTGPQCAAWRQLVVPSRRPAEGFAHTFVPKPIARPVPKSTPPVQKVVPTLRVSYWAAGVGLCVVGLLLGVVSRYAAKARQPDLV